MLWMTGSSLQGGDASRKNEDWRLLEYAARPTLVISPTEAKDLSVRTIHW